jgi:hypothetical protein
VTSGPASWAVRGCCCSTNQPMTQMSNTVRLLTGGPGAQQLLGHSLSYYLVPSLLWTVGLVAVVAPPAVWKLKRT